MARPLLLGSFRKEIIMGTKNEGFATITVEALRTITGGVITVQPKGKQGFAKEHLPDRSQRALEKMPMA